MSDEQPIPKLSPTLAKALDDFERLELEFLIEKPQAEKISGKITVFRGDGDETTPKDDD